MDENNMLAKLGRVKLTLDPNPFGEGKSFRQELLLRDGYVRITGEDDAGQPVTVDIWVDVFQPVIHVEVNGQTETNVTAEYQGWRFEDRVVNGKDIGLGEIPDYWSYPGNVTYHKDTVDYQGDAVLFYHKNDNDDLVMNLAIKQQGLEGKLDMDTWYDPCTNFTFGGLMRGEGMAAAEEVQDGSYNNYAYRAWTLTSEAPTKTRSLEIGLHTGQYETVESWQTDLLKNLEKSDTHTPSIQWWHDFWDRSSVVINDGAGESDTGWQIARNYALFRYMMGCNEYGNLPAKFNGGMFTWDSNGNPDYRTWGGAGMTAQNQRHLYWPLLKSGDYDGMIPEFDFYNNAYPNGEQAVKAYWGHAGTKMDEYPTHYGLSFGGVYNWNHAPDEKLHPGYIDNGSVVYEYVHQLDFAAMMLDYHRYTGRDISNYLDFIEKAVLFHLEHYKMCYRDYIGDPNDDG